MAARKVQTSKIADSIAALMDALKDEILPRADDLRKDGWVSASDYAKTTGGNYQWCKKMLDERDTVEKQKARGPKGKLMMYRVKK